MSCSIVCDAPHSADPRRNSATPPMKIGFRPKTSASFPHASTPTMVAIRKAENTHEYAPIPPSSRAIVGIALVTTVPSNAATTSPQRTEPVATARRKRCGMSKKVRRAGHARTAWIGISTIRFAHDEIGAMDSDQLRAFVTLARTGKFTAAAKRLGSTQPTLSRRVQQLERELGARLVVRAPSGVVLTGAGARFLPQAEHAVASIDAGVAALDELASAPTGLVAIGAQHTIGAYVLPPVLAVFHTRHPVVRLRLVDALPHLLEEKLASGELDLALFNLPIRRLDLTAQKLWQEDYVLAVPPGHRLASRKSIVLTEAVNEPLVVIPNVPATAAPRSGVRRAGAWSRASWSRWTTSRRRGAWWSKGWAWRFFRESWPSRTPTRAGSASWRWRSRAGGSSVTWRWFTAAKRICRRRRARCEPSWSKSWR